MRFRTEKTDSRKCLDKLRGKYSGVVAAASRLSEGEMVRIDAEGEESAQSIWLELEFYLAEQYPGQFVVRHVVTTGPERIEHVEVERKKLPQVVVPFLPQLPYFQQEPLPYKVTCGSSLLHCANVP